MAGPNAGEVVEPNAPQSTTAGKDQVPPGTFHGGDEVPPGTFH